MDTDWLLSIDSIAQTPLELMRELFERHLVFSGSRAPCPSPLLLEATSYFKSSSSCFTTPTSNKMTDKSRKNTPVPASSQSSKGTSNPTSHSASAAAPKTPPRVFSPVTIHTGSRRKPVLVEMVPGVIETHAASRLPNLDSGVDRVLLANREMLVKLTMRAGTSGRTVAESLRRKRPPELKVDDRLSAIEVIRFRPTWPNDGDQGQRCLTAGGLPRGQRGSHSASSESKLHPYLRKYPGCLVFQTRGVFDDDIPVPYSCIASIKRHHDEIVLELQATDGFLPVGEVQIKLVDERTAARLEADLNASAVRCLGQNQSVKSFGFRPVSEIPSHELLNRTELGYPEMFRGDLRLLGSWQNPVERITFDFSRRRSKASPVS